MSGEHMSLAIDGVGSHYPVLAAMVYRTRKCGTQELHWPADRTIHEYMTGGPILELGSGDFSTHFLHMTGRPVLTIEPQTAWFCKYSGYNNGDTRHVISIPIYPSCSYFSLYPHWSIVFVDSAPGEDRVKLIKALRNKTDFFVVHDAEDSPVANYGFAACFKTFKYVWKWGKCNVDTAVLSDRYPIPLEGL